MLRQITFISAFLIITAAAPFYAQSEWERWEKAEVSYTISAQMHNEKENGVSKNAPAGVLSILRSFYSFFISGPDGDNCPFYPSCSNFYVQAVNEEGIIKGTLMFADRFTRDLNFIKDHSRYQLHTSGKLFDPPGNYSLNEEKIFLSQSESRNKK